MSVMRINLAIAFVLAWTITIQGTDTGVRIAAAMVAAGLLIILATDRFNGGDPL